MWPKIERAQKASVARERKGTKKSTKKPKVELESEGESHQWEKLKKHWLCNKCLQIVRSEEGTKSGQRCEGPPKEWKEVLSAQGRSRHRLLIVAGSVPGESCREWLMCGTCGASAQGRRTGELSQPCRGGISRRGKRWHGTRVLKYLDQGIAPDGHSTIQKRAWISEELWKLHGGTQAAWNTSLKAGSSQEQALQWAH